MCTIFDQVKHLGVLLNASQKDEDDDDDIQRQVESLLCSKQVPRHIRSVLSYSEKHFFSCLVACHCMLVNCGANTHRLV